MATKEKKAAKKLATKEKAEAKAAKKKEAKAKPKVKVASLPETFREYKCENCGKTYRVVRSAENKKDCRVCGFKNGGQRIG